LATLLVHGPKSNHRVPMSYHCYLTERFYILDSLLRGSTVGYPSDSLAFLSTVSCSTDSISAI